MRRIIKGNTRSLRRVAPRARRRLPRTASPACAFRRPPMFSTTREARSLPGQCISASQMDSAVRPAEVSPWKAIRSAEIDLEGPRTSVTARTPSAGRSSAAGRSARHELSELRPNADRGDARATSFRIFMRRVRLTTTYRWTSGGGQCPCAAGPAFYLNAVATHSSAMSSGCATQTESRRRSCTRRSGRAGAKQGSDETAGERRFVRCTPDPAGQAPRLRGACPGKPGSA